MTALRPLALLAACAALAAPAGAIDLTGTWQATKDLRCKVRSHQNAGFVETDGNLATFEITQTGEALTVLVNEGDGAYENKFSGLALTHPKRSERGYAVASACTVPGKYYAGSLFVSKAVADAEGGKLSVVFHGNRFGTVAECRGRYERTSATDPGVAASCP